MGTHTYSVTIAKQHEIAIKAKKELAQSIAQALGDLYRISQHARELSTIYDPKTDTIEERSSSYYVLFGNAGAPVRNPDTLESDRAAIFAAIPNPLTEQEYIATIAPMLKAFREEHIPIIDKRKTIEEHRAERAERAQKETEHAERTRIARLHFLAQYGEMEPNKDQPAPKITVPNGAYAITANLTRDESDSMTDYFAPFSPVPYCDALLLGIYHGKAKTESAARQFVNGNPLFEGLEFSWHTDNYSMGRGNYLASNFFDYVDADGKPQRVRWSIEFDWAGNYAPARGYGKHTAAAPQQQGSDTGACKISHNLQHNGIELRFDSKPDENTLDTVKAWGFRWSKFQKIWYAKYSPQMWDKVNAHFGAAPTAQDNDDTAQCETEAIEMQDDDADTLAARVDKAEKEIDAALSQTLDAFAATFGDMDTAHEEYMQDEIARAIGA